MKLYGGISCGSGGYEEDFIRAVKQLKQSKKELKEATKYDHGKPDWTLIPYDALEEVVRVLEFGAGKYARDNWKENGGFKYLRIIKSMLGHIFKYLRGIDKDEESGLCHMAHAVCNGLFILYYIKNKDKYATNDDR